MRNRLLIPCFRAAAILLVAGLAALADPSVTYTTTPLLGGFFEYDMTVMNLGGAEPLNGLLVLYGSSVFNLDDTSTFGTPTGWSVPPVFGDPLFYASNDSSTDIPIGGTLPGFSFQSSTDPSTLMPGDFAVVGIGSNTFNEIPLGDAIRVPEADISFAEILIGVGLSLIIRRLQIGPRKTR
jgi:hypothetical protein